MLDAELRAGSSSSVKNRLRGAHVVRLMRREWSWTCRSVQAKDSAWCAGTSRLESSKIPSAAK
ncbi:hypothetical protein PC114_g18255 [Phytophthora cactorum]|nr:hypothetical protein PC114_g18255 [Phytophthora cactorum]